MKRIDSKFNLFLCYKHFINKHKATEKAMSATKKVTLLQRGTIFLPLLFV